MDLRGPGRVVLGMVGADEEPAAEHLARAAEDELAAAGARER
jgi:hypothetical protein